ncbi:MAG: thioredoxin family protein [Pirellulales bacterium]|nr:thioredoxin family protein [Pirellulales bacterium]
MLRSLRTAPSRFAGLVLVVALMAGLASSGHSETASHARLGKKIDNFELTDAHGKQRSLADLADAKLVIVAFLGTECPLANLYAPRLSSLAEKLKPEGVAVIGINSNQQDTPSEVAAHAAKLELTFPVLKDVGNRVADQFGAERTPEVFLLDADRAVRYVGRIDDQYSVGVQKKQAGRHDLEVAIEELLAGKEVTEPATDPPGCLIGRVKHTSTSDEVTYANQISRIMQKHCTECHHEGQVAPFVLTSYEDVLGWADMVREVVHNRRMPPWQASPEHGDFKNNPSLSSEELERIDRWVENGCPEGDPAQLPEPIEFAEGWGISQPDDVFYMSDEPFAIPAEGAVDYQYYTVDPGFTEDKWIKEAEVKAGNPAVVHHVIVFIQAPGASQFGSPQMAFAPGMTPRRLENGAAIKIPAGSKLMFQNHYTPNGKATTDRSYVGFVYADPKEVTQEVQGGACGNFLFKIPPHAGNHVVVAEQKFRRETILLGMNPHMHVRGKSFKYELKYPDGTMETLLDVPKYDFNWQLWYMLQEPKVIPAGSRMVCTASFDNSDQNPSNPDPTKEVKWGEQTWDEMMFGFYSTIKPADHKKKSKRPMAEAEEPAADGEKRPAAF